MAIPDLLSELLAAPGPSGYEELPTARWRAAASAFAEVAGDTLGSSVARVAGGDGPLLAVVGHIDEIGFIVTHVDDEGFLSIRKIGGWDEEVIVGHRVQLLTRGGVVSGVVARRALRGEEAKAKAQIRELHVDVGAHDRAEAEQLVALGDAGVVAAEPLELAGRRIVSRSLDNRLGAYLALEVARLCAGAGTPGDVAAVAAVQEEIGSAGARAIVYGLEPQVAIVFDVTWATDPPGGDVRDDGSHGLGSGPAIMRGPTVHPRVFELLVESAEAEGIPHTVEVQGGATATDADAIHFSRIGLPTGVVSIPLRYMHSPVEMVQLDDVEACARLVAAFAGRLQRGLSFER